MAKDQLHHYLKIAKCLSTLVVNVIKEYPNKCPRSLFPPKKTHLHYNGCHGYFNSIAVPFTNC